MITFQQSVDKYLKQVNEQEFPLKNFTFYYIINTINRRILNYMENN